MLNRLHLVDLLLVDVGGFLDALRLRGLLIGTVAPAAKCKEKVQCAALNIFINMHKYATTELVSEYIKRCTF